MIHILTIKQQVRHQGKMAKQSRTMLKPGNFLLPMGDREILLFANHRFIALGAPQVKEQSFSHQVSVKQMLAIRIKYLRVRAKRSCGFQYSLGYKCSCSSSNVSCLGKIVIRFSQNFLCLFRVFTDRKRRNSCLFKLTMV